MTWVLIVGVYVYIAFGGGVSISITAIPGYETRDACIEASKEAIKMAHAIQPYCIPGPAKELTK